MSSKSEVNLTETQVRLRDQLRLLSEKTSEENWEQKKYLLGRVLTIIDAVASDPEQRKAIKDVVNDLFYSPQVGPLGITSRTSWQFEQIAKANGFELYNQPEQNVGTTLEPMNPYEELSK